MFIMMIFNKKGHRAAHHHCDGMYDSFDDVVEAFGEAILDLEVGRVEVVKRKD